MMAFDLKCIETRYTITSMVLHCVVHSSVESKQRVVGAGVRGGLLPGAGGAERGGLESHHVRTTLRSYAGLA